MKTPLRGEMLRGADFIIGVVSARGSDPIQTVSYDRHGPRNYQILHYSMGTKHVLYISDSRGNKQHCKLGLFMLEHFSCRAEIPSIYAFTGHLHGF